jgi:DNA helicase-2/ATP-dependent DNA helicase PcrA
MDVSSILDQLNDAQRQAVTGKPTNQLILAGAGSGKTRVLVHRIAWLVQVENVSPYSVLAVTFTNKAAKEMRGRIEELLGVNPRGMWVGTFHDIAHRLLKQHWQEAGLPKNFQILDSDDQLRLVKRVSQSLNLDDKKWLQNGYSVQWGNLKSKLYAIEKSENIAVEFVPNQIQPIFLLRSSNDEMFLEFNDYRFAK